MSYDRTTPLLSALIRPSAYSCEAFRERTRVADLTESKRRRTQCILLILRALQATRLTCTTGRRWAQHERNAAKRNRKLSRELSRQFPFVAACLPSDSRLSYLFNLSRLNEYGNPQIVCRLTKNKDLHIPSRSRYCGEIH